MNQDKVKVKLSDISMSMLHCLWDRAQVSKEHSSLFYDAKAVEFVEKIETDYDFSTSDDVPFEGIWFNVSRKLNLPPCGPSVLRAKHFDDKIRVYITKHPRASIVSLAAGLDATFYRVDNGLIHWYDLDLPAVIDVRRQLLPEPDRVTYIAKSLFDPSWCKDIKDTEDGIFMTAGGVLPFFEESEIKQFVSMLADKFPGGEIVFDVSSKLSTDFEAGIDVVLQEQRDAMKAALAEVLRDWWEKAPQSQRDKLYGIITTLKTSTKLKGKAWADIETWLNEFSAEEIEQVLHDLIKSYYSGVMKWALEDANEITKWDDRVTVLDQFPLFKNIPRDSLSADARRVMDYSDKSGGSNIFHLRV